MFEDLIMYGLKKKSQKKFKNTLNLMEMKTQIIKFCGIQ